MKRFKIAFVLNMLSPYWHDVLNKLADENFRIKVFIGEFNEPMRKYSKTNTEELKFDIQKNKNISFDLRNYHLRTEILHIQYSLYNDLKNYSPDLIVSNELGLRTLISKIYSRLNKIPMIPWICVSSHTERNISTLRKIWRKWLLSNVQNVFTNLTQATEYLQNEFKLKDNQIYNTPYCLDVNKYSAKVNSYLEEKEEIKKDLNLDGKIVTYIGQMIERKGLFQLSKLFEQYDFNNDSFSLLFVGGKLPSAIEQNLKNRNINFVNIDFVQPNDLPKYYAVSDFFLFPSLEDEWGIVVNEAAASGLPILSSIYAAASWDLVFDDINGYRFDPLDMHDFKTKFNILLNMPDNELIKFGEKSKELVKKYDISFTTGNFIRGFSYYLNK